MLNMCGGWEWVRDMGHRQGQGGKGTKDVSIHLTKIPLLGKGLFFPFKSSAQGFTFFCVKTKNILSLTILESVCVCGGVMSIINHLFWRAIFQPCF